MSWLRSCAAEFMGTFMLVFVGAAAVASKQGIVVGALSHGLIVISAIYTFGHISGAHINPAVTAGMLAGGQITPARAAGYWIAQFSGGIAASSILAMLIPGDTGQTIGSLTQNAVWRAALLELILTFLLVSAIYQAAVYNRAGNLAGVVIGCTLIGLIFAGGIYTGASLNPARTLGPALVAGNLSYTLPYLMGIFGGGILAGLVHRRHRSQTFSR
jgi:aquaporin Z